MTHTFAAVPARSRLRRASRATRSTMPLTSTFVEKVQIICGTELAAAGIDLLALRQLMGHVSPETTAGYVHLSDEHLAAEHAAARAVIEQ